MEEAQKKPDQLNPGQILSMSGFYWQTCTLHAGVKLDVFTAIGDDRCEAGQVAEKLGTEPRATAMLLNALCALGLLEKTTAAYTNTPVARMFLSKASPKYIGYMIMHHHHLVESWAKLDEAVKTGQPTRSRSSFADEERRESFLMGMFNTAMNQAPGLVPTIDLSDRSHLLDLGGGPGTYAIQFCKHNPHLKATVFDLETTRPFAEKTIARFDMASRIDFAAGDFTADEIPGSYDVAWLSHMLHGESRAVCERVIAKAVAALAPGGLILIHEFILDNSKDSPLFPALFSLNMLLGTNGGQAYTEDELVGMLKKAGVTDIVRTPYKGPTESGIMQGTVT